MNRYWTHVQILLSYCITAARGHGHQHPFGGPPNFLGGGPFRQILPMAPRPRTQEWNQNLREQLNSGGNSVKQVNYTSTAKI